MTKRLDIEEENEENKGDKTNCIFVIFQSIFITRSGEK